MHHFSRLLVVDDRANRHRQLDVLAVLAGLVAALAVPAAISAMLRIEAEVQQRVVVIAGNHEDRAAMAAIAARRSALGNELLAAERHAAVAAIAGLDPDLDFVDEHVEWSLNKRKAALYHGPPEKLKGM